MCEYLSFLVNSKGQIAIGNFSGHGGIYTRNDRNNWREAEWTTNDPANLYVRMHFDDEREEKNKNWWKALVLGMYKTRDELLADFPVGKIHNDDQSSKEKFPILYTKMLRKRVTVAENHRVRGTFILVARDKEFKNIVEITYHQHNAYYGRGALGYLYVGGYNYLSYRPETKSFRNSCYHDELDSETHSLLKSLGIVWNAKTRCLSLQK